MRRVMFILLCGILAGAATKHPPGHHAASGPLPVPPLPPRQAQGSEAAPVPDRNVHEPAVALNERTTVSPHVFVFQQHDTARGFNPGAKYQSAEERGFWQPFGLNVRVPLH